MILYLVAWIVVFWAAIALPSLEDICCFTVLGDKHRILEQASSPKMIITGGSNVLFGVDGEKIGRKFNMKVVNMGLCLMFPLPYLFEEVKDTIKSGDIVVLSPEYSLYSTDMENLSIMRNILEGYPRAIEWILRSNSCSLEEKGRVLFHLRTLGLQKLEYAFKHIRQIVSGRCRWTYGKPNSGLLVLNSKNLDSCGDLTWHLTQPIPRDGMERKISIRVPKQIDDHTASEINKFGEYCRAKGAEFVLIPPSIPDTMYKRSKISIDRLVIESRKRLTVPILASPERYAFSDSMIFGGHYHLDKIGRELRSQRMIEDLQSTVDEVRSRSRK